MYGTLRWGAESLSELVLFTNVFFLSVCTEGWVSQEW